MIQDLKTTFLDGYDFSAANLVAGATAALGKVLDIASVLQSGLVTTPSGGNLPAANVTPQWPNGGSAGVQARKVGSGQPVYLVLRVRNTGTDVTTQANGLTFKLTTDSNKNLTTAPVDLLTSQAYTAGIKSGVAIFVVALPIADCKQFLGIKAVNGATTAIVAGVLDGFLTTEVSDWVSYGIQTTN